MTTQEAREFTEMQYGPDGTRMRMWTPNVKNYYEFITNLLVKQQEAEDNNLLTYENLSSLENGDDVYLVAHHDDEEDTVYHCLINNIDDVIQFVSYTGTLNIHIGSEDDIASNNVSIYKYPVTTTTTVSE